MNLQHLTALTNLSLDIHDPQGVMHLPPTIKYLSLLLKVPLAFSALTYLTNMTHLELWSPITHPYDLSPLTCIKKLNTRFCRSPVVLPPFLVSLATTASDTLDLSQQTRLTKLEIRPRNPGARVVFPSRLDRLCLWDEHQAESNLPEIVVDRVICNYPITPENICGLPRSSRVVDAGFVGVSLACLVEALPHIDKKLYRFLPNDPR